MRDRALHREGHVVEWRLQGSRPEAGHPLARDERDGSRVLLLVSCASFPWLLELRADELGSQMPFAEDIRALRFPSLVNRFNHHGVRLEEHKLLPTPAQNDAMSAFVDSMDLSEAGGFDEDGCAPLLLLRRSSD